MTGGEGFFHWDGDTLILDIKVQPRASRDELGDVLDKRLKIRITAPPVDGKANAHLLKYLAGVFKVPRSRIRILSGERGRDKRLSVQAPERLPAVLR